MRAILNGRVILEDDPATGFSGDTHLAAVANQWGMIALTPTGPVVDRSDPRGAYAIAVQVLDDVGIPLDEVTFEGAPEPETTTMDLTDVVF